MLPSALSRSDLVARCMLGVLHSAGAAICLATCRSLKSGTWPRRLTQSPELGFGFCLFSSWSDFDFVFCVSLLTRLPQPSLGCCCARVRTLLRSPTDDATTPPVFSPWQ